MGFFHNEARAQAPAKQAPKVRLKDIPVAAMAELGCQVCPLDKTVDDDCAKLKPVGGGGSVDVYILFSGPSQDDGFPHPSGGRVTDTGMRAILDKLPRGGTTRVRVGGITQCATGTQVVNQAAVACCRNRVIADIEDCRPLVVVGVGDAAAAWATGLDAYAPKWRGSFTVTKIGSHVCQFYSLMYPNWAYKDKKKKQYGKSEHEWILENDLRNLFDRLDEADDDLVAPFHYSGPYDEGIERITGTEPGDFQRLERALADLASEKRVGVDIETNGLRPWSLKNPLIVTTAIGTFERTVAFAMDHPQGWGSDVQRRKVWSLVGEFLIHSGIKECHNAAMEMEWFAYFYGSRMLRLTEWDDTMAQCHTLDERPGTKSLDVQIRKAFGFFLKDQSTIDVSRPNWYLQYNLKDILRYNGLDSKWTNRLSRHLRPYLAASPTLTYQHERKVRLASTLVLMEARGLPVDMDFAQKMERRLEEEVGVVAKKIAATPEVKEYERKFGTFSPTNADHVLSLMQKVCKRDEIERRDRDGATKYTTDEEALSSMPKKEVPSAPLILEHRGSEKLLSTYMRPLTTRRIVSLDGRIHSKYSSMTAVTGRLAGEDPNPQNWPKRKHKEIRGVVACAADRWILACDYGQIEFRVVGMASGDDNLVKYCWDPKSDVHKKWAEKIVKAYGPVKDWIVSEFGVDWDEKGLKTLRQEAKNKWVFPQLFGSSTQSCARNLLLPDDVATELGREFWDEFRTTKKWQQETLRFFEKHGYVETLGGIRRHGAMSPNEIINMPIQGTAAEIVCEGMVALSELSMETENPDIHPILNVHDDLTFEPLDENLDENLQIIVREMCMPRFDYINVPLVVEASIGPRWSELEEIGVYRSDAIFNTRNPYKD